MGKYSLPLSIWTAIADIAQVPSTANRVYSLVLPHKASFELNYISGLVLPLQGFWNSIIYVSISWPAFEELLFPNRKVGVQAGDQAGSIESERERPQ